MRTLGLVATVIMVGMALVGGVLDLVGFNFPLQKELAMPPYLSLILGVAKVLGAATFFTNRFPDLCREWAYAGFTFELLGAAACHLLAGGGFLHAAPAFFDFSFVVVSYFLWHGARRARAGELPGHRSVSASGATTATEPHATG